MQILFKPRPEYTTAGRENNVQGTITLSVTFLANGKIGNVTPVNSLPYGLTEKAIEAARKIQFKPAKKNGVSITVTKNIIFTFTIY